MSALRSVTLGLVGLGQLVSLAAALAQQPLPVGPEFQVNSYTTGVQGVSSVAMDGAGNFVVVWQSNGGVGADFSIQAQRYDSSGAPQGDQFQVNSYNTGHQSSPIVAADAAGNFVVVWASGGSAGTDTDAGSIQAQRYDSAGAPLGPEFQVNTYTTGNQLGPGVAVSPSGGDFVMVWQSAGSTGTDTSTSSIQAQRFDSAGMAQGSEFQVNSYTTADQFWPAVSADPMGNFVVTWDSLGSAGSDSSFSYSVQARRFDSSGIPQGPDFQVNSYTTGNQLFPSVATDAASNFVVAWRSFESQGIDQYSLRTVAQRYDNNGTPLGAEFQVNSFTEGPPYTYNELRTHVAAEPDGDFIVVWSGPGSTGALGIQARRYASDGTAQGGEFQVNTYTTGGQYLAAAAVDGNDLVITWTSTNSDASDDFFSVQAQRFMIPLTTTSSTSTTSTTLPPTGLLPGRTVLVKRAAFARFVAKPATGDSFSLPFAVPVAEGGSLRFFDTANSAGDNSYTLVAGTAWKGLGRPAGSKGYRYRGAGTTSDPCRVVLVKPQVIKGICVGSSVTLAPPFAGDVGIVLSLGTTDRYCAQFGGDESRNDATLTKRKNAPAPGACP